MAALAFGSVASEPQSGLGAARACLTYANSYTRLPTLLALWRGGGVEHWDWLALLGEEWSVCDNIGEHADALLEDTPFADLADDPAALRHRFMDADELRQFDALPEVVTIYRGCYAANKWGLSWSLDRAMAERFPTLHRYRQDGQALLVTARIAKDRIIALKGDRGEAEIIAVRPTHISTRHLRAS